MQLYFLVLAFKLGQRVSGGHRRGATPVPISNTVVKPSSADGTAFETGVGE